MKVLTVLFAIFLLKTGWSQKKIVERKEVQKIETKVITEKIESAEQNQTVDDPIAFELEVNELLNGENVDVRITEINGVKEIFISSTSNGIVSKGAYSGEAANEVQKIIDNRGVPFNQSPTLDAPKQKIKIKQKFKSNR
jgi:hypothetical protein